MYCLKIMFGENSTVLMRFFYSGALPLSKSLFQLRAIKYYGALHLASASLVHFTNIKMLGFDFLALRYSCI